MKERLGSANTGDKSYWEGAGPRFPRRLGFFDINHKLKEEGRLGNVKMADRGEWSVKESGEIKTYRIDYERL